MLLVRNMKNTELAERLKTELLQAIENQMERKEISQGEVARRIGAFRSNVNQVLRGKANASLDFLVKIAESVELEVEMKFKNLKV